MEKMHKNLFHSVTREQFAAMLSALDAKIKRIGNADVKWSRRQDWVDARGDSDPLWLQDAKTQSRMEVLPGTKPRTSDHPVAEDRSGRPLLLHHRPRDVLGGAVARQPTREIHERHVRRRT